jgi:hypothetical protein
MPHTLSLGRPLQRLAHLWDGNVRFGQQPVLGSAHLALFFVRTSAEVHPEVLLRVADSPAEALW